MTLGQWLFHTPTHVWFRVTGWLTRDGAPYICGVTDDGMWARWPAAECAGVA